MRFNVFERVPLLPIALSLILGIVVGDLSLHYLSTRLWYITIIISLFLYFCFYKKNQIQSFILLFAFFAVGGTLSVISELDKRITLPHGIQKTNAVVISKIIEKNKVIRFDAVVTDGVLSGKRIKVSILKDTIQMRHISLVLNSGISFRSELKHFDNFHNTDFDYEEYMLNQGFVAQTFVYQTDWMLVRHDLNNLSLIQRARLKADILRLNLLDYFRKSGLDKENLAVVAAMVLGDKTQLDGAQREAYSLSGASHVLALSGLHLSIIFSFLNFVTFRRRNKTVSSILLISAIWLYAFLVGLMPSVVRSAIMLSVMTLVGITGRNSFSLNVLSFAAIIMLLLNPLSLYDIGFQLSFIAVAFIVTFCRSVTNIISVTWIINHRILAWLWQLFVVSLLAQLGTFPLVLYYFVNLPLLSLPLSFIIIPATTLILYLALMFILIGWLPYIGAVIARVLSLVVEFQNSVVEYVVSLPFSVQTGINVSPWQTIVLYGIILCFLLLIIKSKSLIKS